MLLPLGELQRVLDRLREAEALAERLHDQRRLGQVLAATISSWWLMGAPERAVEYGERACAIAAALGDVVVQMRSTLSLGQVYVTMGYYRKAADYLSRAATHYRQALALAEELGMRPLQAHCHRDLGT